MTKKTDTCPSCKYRKREEEKMMKGKDFNLFTLLRETCPICGAIWSQKAKDKRRSEAENQPLPGQMTFPTFASQLFENMISNETKGEKNMEGTNTMEELIEQVKEWGKNRGLDKSDPCKQAVKLQEEVGELAAAILRGNHLEQEDAVGDILVVLINLCVELGIRNINECLWCAYNEIKDREGETIDGVFIKKEDLK